MADYGDDAGGKAGAKGGKPLDSDSIKVEVERQGSRASQELVLPEKGDLATAVRRALGVGEETFVFERDQDEPVSGPSAGRKAMRVVVSKSKQIAVVVRYEDQEKSETFPPSKTVFKVLQWAISKKAYNLDATAAARANLILPDADTPLPKEDVIASYVPEGEDTLIVDLTLRDFTNG